MPKARGAHTGGDPSPEWNHEVAKLLATIDDEKELPRAIVEALYSLTPADMGYVRVGDLQSKQNLYFDPAHYRFPDSYTGELVVLDPLYNVTKDGRRGVFSLRTAMPQGFEKTPYFKEFYSSGGWCDELIHTVDVPNTPGRILTVGLVRSNERGAFDSADIARHEATYPVIETCAKRLLGLISGPLQPTAPTHTDRDVEAILKDFGAEVLTPRELEVIHLVLRGHNTQSVAATLDIAADTVKLHRKHAYAKLRVSSQGELFFKFLESLGLASDSSD